MYKKNYEITQIGNYDFFIKENSYIVRWDLLSNCNFDCPYCAIKNTRRSEPYQIFDFNQIKKCLSFLNYIQTRYSYLKVNLFGGEPTLYPYIFDLIQSCEFTPTLWTNFHKPLEFWNKLISIRKFNLCCTYHHNGQSLDDFIYKLINILDQEILTRFIILWNKTNKNDILDIFFNVNKILNNYVDNNLQIQLIIEQPIDRSIFNDEDFKYLPKKDNNVQISFKNGVTEKITIEEALLRGYDNFKYFKCYTGARGLAISHKGDVYYCQSYMHQNINPIFNIYRDNWKDYIYILDNPIICLSNKCTCEINIPKYKVLNI